MYTGQDNIITQDEDVFKNKFKYYKSNRPKPSLHDVIIPRNSTSGRVIPVAQENVIEDWRTYFLGLKKTSSWKTFGLLHHPGLFVIENPFTAIGQRYWIRKCLQVYPRRPNQRNIDKEVDIQDWWEECFKSKNCDSQLLKKLRWTTLGYHHDWDTKIYSEENKTPFPDDLAELCDVVARYFNYTNYKAEAAIVNYYHMDSTLSAHTDHSEVNLEAPLFSFSFGQSAIFLIGGKNKSIEPSAVLINSGDIVVMSKEARLCYHAVPKILPASHSPWRDVDQDHCPFELGNFEQFKYIKEPMDVLYAMQNVDNVAWSPFNTYIEESRINLNVRQVLNENQNSL